MAATFPCPNPNCTQVFDLDAITGVTTLTCPKCGTSFRFRAKAPARQLGGTEALQAPTQVLPASPNAVPAPSAPPPLPDDSNAETVMDFGSPLVVVPSSRRRQTHGRSLAAKILLGSIFTLLLGSCAFALCWLVLFLIQKPSIRDIQNRETGNFLLRAPDRSWEESPELVQAFKPIQIALRKTGARPSNNMALYYRDYERRSPSEAEVFSEGLAKLRIYFDQLEYDLKPKNETDALGGQPAQVIQFRGISRPDNILCFGECWMTSYRGYAYWFITWAPLLGDEQKDARDKAVAEWPTLRQRFSILDARESWREEARRTAKFVGVKGTVELRYDEKVWTPEEEEGVELSLIGHDPRLTPRQRNAGKAARIKVCILDKKAENLDEAIKLAREDLLERKKEKDPENGTYLYPETKINETKDESVRKAEPPKTLGSLDGRVLRLQVENTPQRIRFVVIGVAVLPRGVFVIDCDCDNARKSDDDPRRPDRDFWEPEFMAVLASVGPVKSR